MNANSSLRPKPPDPARPGPTLLTAGPNVPSAVFSALDRLCGPAEAPLGLAVSGGSDSTALLFAAAEWAKSRARTLRVATVDHGLRPEARRECGHVAALCAGLGLDCDILTWRPAAAPRVTQARARDARHALLSRWAAAHGVRRLALGHTQDDRLETALLRARAGSDWFGLPGLREATASPAWPDGLGLVLIRPLLTQGREALRRWLADSGRSWIDDPSNENTDHERVRMRALMAALPDAARDSLARSVERLDRLREARERALRTVLQDSVDWRPDGAAAIRRDFVAGLGPDMRVQALGLVALCVSGAASPPRRSALRALAEAIVVAPSGARVVGDAWFVWTPQLVAIRPRPEGERRTAGAPAASVIPIRPGQAAVFDGRFELRLSADAVAGGRLVTWDAALAAGADTTGAVRIGDARSRRSLPVLLDENSAVVTPVLDAGSADGALLTGRALHRRRALHLAGHAVEP